MKGGRAYDHPAPLDSGPGWTGPDLCEALSPGLRLLEGGGGPVWCQLSHGPPALGPPDSKNPPQRHGGSGPLRGSGEAAGGGRQAGLRHREDFDCRLPGGPKENGGWMMAIASRFVIVSLLFLLVFLIGGVFLQIFLSKRESRWPGLVLPLLTFLWSLLGPLNVMDTGSVSRNVLLVLVTLLAGNIPTLVLLAIYWAVREKRRVRDQIDKMKIDEL